MTAHIAPESTAHFSPKWGAHLDRNIYIPNVQTHVFEMAYLVYISQGILQRRLLKN